MKKTKLIKKLLYPIVLSFVLTETTNADVQDFDSQMAYRMAVASDCTYHVVLADWSLGSAFKCLKQHSEIPTFSSLAEEDVVFWPTSNNNPKGINAYVLFRTADELILAIRGTQPPIPDSKTDISMASDWLNNFDAAPTHDGFHPGFLSAWNFILQNLQNNPEAKRLLNEKGQRKFIITGHSKGGAIAIIAAIKMQEKGAEWSLPKADEIYAFEAARPVTIKKAEELAGKLPYLIRFDYKADIVPLVPPGAALKAKLANYEVLEKTISLAFPVAKTFSYESNGLGKLYYVNSRNELLDIPESDILEQQIATAGVAYQDVKGNIVQPILKREIPLCHTLVNNHLAYVDYLKQYSTKGKPAKDEAITSNWDQYCDAKYVITTIGQDFKNRFSFTKAWQLFPINFHTP